MTTEKERITANLPAIDFDQTEAFYTAIGFAKSYRDEHWMILKRGDFEIEFFPHPTLKPEVSWFSACVRVPDAQALDRLYAAWREAVPSADGIPRTTEPKEQPWGMKMFALIDCNGSLLRCMAPL